jgi:hypothetical protein
MGVLMSFPCGKPVDISNAPHLMIKYTYERLLGVAWFLCVGFWIEVRSGHSIIVPSIVNTVPRSGFLLFLGSLVEECVGLYSISSVTTVS